MSARKSNAASGPLGQCGPCSCLIFFLFHAALFAQRSWAVPSAQPRHLHAALPLTFRGSDPRSRGEPIQPGPSVRSASGCRRGGAQRRGEKPLRCADPTPQSLPFTKAPASYLHPSDTGALRSTSSEARASEAPPHHGLTHASVPARPQLLRCSALLLGSSALRLTLGPVVEFRAPISPSVTPYRIVIVGPSRSSRLRRPTRPPSWLLPREVSLIPCYRPLSTFFAGCRWIT
ncbi:hypothetical protein NDU88_004797 [Pleurodeles waltl]|uniref:Secreted protein n=1 Tax=Pleurodeles waltl TaxID=8319 RepID=A0AAV7UG41_PLEWA|nr:hypothetical protein NDU88_004797 [Pleurodeles waltl]